MFLRGLIHILLTFTLILQLFPTNQSGRFFLSDLPDDECSEMAGAKGQLRQLTEEEHKDIHIEHNGIAVSFTNISSRLFHFSETLPSFQPGAIPTPPPNGLSSC
jgi:hypothetical protein